MMSLFTCQTFFNQFSDIVFNVQRFERGCIPFSRTSSVVDQKFLEIPRYVCCPYWWIKQFVWISDYVTRIWTHRLKRERKTTLRQLRSNNSSKAFVKLRWKFYESWQARVCMRVFSTLMSWSNENKSCIRVDESWQARICMRVFSILMSWSNENKSCMRVDESWQARICMRVFSTLMSWTNENKSCMRVDESWQAKVCMRVFSTLMSWSNENKSCMRVGESNRQARVCMRVFSTLMSWSNENKSCMRVDNCEFVMTTKLWYKLER